MNRFHASWAEVGGTGRLVCRVRAAPPPTFVWSSSSDLILLNSDKYTIHEPQVIVSCTFVSPCTPDKLVPLISKHTYVVKTNTCFVLTLLASFRHSWRTVWSRGRLYWRSPGYATRTIQVTAVHPVTPLAQTQSWCTWGHPAVPCHPCTWQ